MFFVIRDSSGNSDSIYSAYQVASIVKNDEGSVEPIVEINPETKEQTVVGEKTTVTKAGVLIRLANNERRRLRFKTVAERDAWLAAAIKQLGAVILGDDSVTTSARMEGGKGVDKSDANKLSKSKGGAAAD